MVGGAAMLLAYDGKTATRDVDCAIREGRRALQAAARRVARAEDLGEYWLNDAVTWQYLPESPDRREEKLLEYSHLTVSVASRERMLAMRLDAGRAEQLDDVWRLAEQLDLKTTTAIVKTHQAVYGDKGLDNEYETELWRQTRERTRIAKPHRMRPGEAAPARPAPAAESERARRPEDRGRKGWNR